MNFPVGGIDICKTNEEKKNSFCSRIGENDAGAAGIFYGKLGLAILTGNATLKKKPSQSNMSINIE